MQSWDKNLDCRYAFSRWFKEIKMREKGKPCYRKENIYIKCVNEWVIGAQFCWSLSEEVCWLCLWIASLRNRETQYLFSTVSCETRAEPREYRMLFQIESNIYFLHCSNMLVLNIDSSLCLTVISQWWLFSMPKIKAWNERVSKTCLLLQ